MEWSNNIAGAIVVVGLALTSVYAHLASNGDIGWGWGFWAVFTLIFWTWETKDEDGTK